MTAAAGSPRFARMAEHLARSCELCGMRLPRAVVVSTPDPGLADFYHQVIVDPALPGDVSCKLHAALLSPFERTLFIDSDCLLYRPLHHLLRASAGSDFIACGKEVVRDWAGIGLAGLREEYPEVRSYISYHTGIFYFERTERAARLFRCAQSCLQERPELFRRFGDEPGLSISAARIGLQDSWYKDPGLIMPLWKTDRRLGLHIVKLDIRKAIAVARFAGRYSSSHVVHFSSHGSRHSRCLYARETSRLRRLLPRCDLECSSRPRQWDDGSLEQSSHQQ